MSPSVSLGIDIGTQSVRVMAVTEEGVVAASSAQPLEGTRDGAHHEQQPELWWRAVTLACRAVTAALGSSPHISGLAVDATSGTILLMDEQLRPLTPGLMYDDGRASAEAEICNQVGGNLWRELSYRMQNSWALPKLLWLERHGGIGPGASLAHQNDFINARLAGHRLAADSSNSLKTGYDLVRREWPRAVFDELGLRLDIFPAVVAPGVEIGLMGAAAASETGLPAGTPILSGMTDGCAAQIASGATRPGSWNSVVGTTLVMKGVTAELLHDPLGVVYSHRSADGFWLPGGASSTGAGAIARDFAADELPALNRAALELGATPLVVYPLTGRGERYPFAAPDAEGFMLGEPAPRTRTRPAAAADHFCATLQGIAFIERLSFAALRQIGAETNGLLTISGGATKSEALNQMRADIMERELSVPAVTEGAFGMAMLAASAGSSFAEVTERMVRIERTIMPRRGFAPFAEQYAVLVRELAARGWLPASLAAFALQEVSA